MGMASRVKLGKIYYFLDNRISIAIIDNENHFH